MLPSNEQVLAQEKYSRTSSLMQGEIVAGGVFPVIQYGETYYLVDSTGPIDIATNYSPRKQYRKGQGEKVPSEQRFTRLELHNPNSFDISFRLWVGFGDFLDRTAEVIEGYTRVVGYPSTSIPAVDEVVSTGDPQGIYVQRKQIIVSNLDQVNNLFLKDENNNYVCAVFPLTSITIPVSGPIKVVNENGSPVNVCLSEVWYTLTP